MIEKIFSIWPQMADEDIKLIKLKSQKRWTNRAMSFFPIMRLQGTQRRELLALLKLFADINTRLVMTKNLPWALGSIILPRWFMPVLEWSRHAVRRLMK